MAEWQTIDTAPKDGSEVLTWHDYHVPVSNPIHPHYGKRGKVVIQAAIGAMWPSDIAETGMVTHWQPLPPPPIAAAPKLAGEVSGED